MARYLIARRPEVVVAGDEGKWAQEDEPVVPWYPATLRNVFLGTGTFRPALYALVADVPDLDIDALADKLIKEYPGLPRTLHQNYVLAIAKAATANPLGTLYRILITIDVATLVEVNTENTYRLWDNQPLGGDS